MKVGRRQRSFGWAVGLVILAACDEHVGCTPVLSTEDGQLELLDRQVIAGSCRPMRERGPILVGTRLCPRLDCGRDVPGCEVDDDVRLDPRDVEACFSSAVEGPAVVEDACLEVAGAGELTWTFTPRDCPARQAGYAPAPDRLVLPTIAADEITARLQSPGDAFALRELRPADASGFPLEAIPGPGEPVLLLAGQDVPLAVVLEHPEHEVPVAWNPGAWTLEVVDSRGGASPRTRWEPAGVAVVTLEVGVEATLAVRSGTDEIVVGRVRGAAPEEVTRLEVIVGYAPDDDRADGLGMPVGARALGRTEDGTAVLGLDPRWQVIAGALPVWRDTGRTEWGSDHVALVELDGRACHAVPKRDTVYEATLVAGWRDLEAQRDLTWRASGESGLGRAVAELFGRDDFEPSEHCLGPGFPAADGCAGCRQGSPRSMLPLALLVLIVARRSRAAPPR
jgi:hypothetical protein